MVIVECFINAQHGLECIRCRLKPFGKALYVCRSKFHLHQSAQSGLQVNVRTRDNKVHGTKSVADFIADLRQLVADHQ